MIRTILVPLDGSQLAEQGLATACRVARETGATLALVRSLYFFGVDDKTQESERRNLQEARRYLRDVQRSLVQQGFAVTIELLPGDPVAAILFAAEVHDVDLISISTHGYSGLQHALVGSVAEAVLRRAHTPVLLTCASEPPVQHAATPFGSILVPLDGTAFAETALSYLRQEQLGRSANLLLLRVVAPGVVPYIVSPMGEGVSAVLDEAARQTEKNLLAAEAYLQATGTAFRKDDNWRTRVLVGDAGEEILDAARSGGAELIVIATHGRRGWDRLLHGSVTHHLLHHTQIPLLILQGTAVENPTPAAADEETRPMRTSAWSAGSGSSKSEGGA